MVTVTRAVMALVLRRSDGGKMRSNESMAT